MKSIRKIEEELELCTKLRPGEVDVSRLCWLTEHLPGKRCENTNSLLLFSASWTLIPRLSITFLLFCATLLPNCN